MPIFRVKSVKIYTGQKNLHGYTRGSRNKYQVWPCTEESRLQSGVEENSSKWTEILEASFESSISLS